jgi:ABC-type amino acid transport substrate-binding protein
MSLKTKVKFTVVKKYPERSLLDRVFAEKNAPERLKKIRARKVLKVGYNPNTMPFCYFNSKGDLVGYDVQMAQLLAKDLGCSIEFIRIDFPDLGKALSNGVIDIAMMGVYVNLDRISKMDFTESYMDIHPALIVRDYDKKRFENQSRIRDMKNLKLAVLKGSAFIPALKKGCPNAKLVLLDDYEDFFSGKIKADALVHSAEQGATWALKHPEYSVVILKNVRHNTTVAYAIAKGDLPFLEYLNYWLKLKKLNKITDDNYKYWVLGVVPELKKPRWCVLRDVLHWLD